MVKFLLVLFTATGIFMPVLYHLDILRNPCFPMYVGYWLSNQCLDVGKPLKPTWTIDETSTHVAIALVSYFVWSFLLVGFTLNSSIQVILFGHCFRIYVSAFGRKIRKTKSSFYAIQRELSTYRELQIIYLEYRAIFSNLMIGAVTSVLLIICIICLYNTIQVVSGFDTTGGSLQYNIFYGWTGFCCMLEVVVVNGILADVYKNGNAGKNKINGDLGLKKNKYFQKWFKSCPVLRINLGGSNYFDSLTPLNLLDFVIDRTVSLLLVQI